MSDGIAKDSSASMVVENAQNLIKAEFDNLKLKLEETEAELQKEKAELQKEKQKSKQLSDSLKALTTPTGAAIKLRPKRARISLTMNNCAESFKEGFCVFSDPVDVADFQWKLQAKERAKGFLGLFLHLCPPKHHKGHSEFDVSMSFRLFNVFPEKDINNQGTFKFKHDNPPYGWGFQKFIEIKKLLDSASEFVQHDGTIQLEVHFTVVKVATLDQLLPVEEKENGNKTGAN